MTMTDSGGSPVITFSDLAISASSTFTFQATVDSTTGPYQTLTDNASASYSTLPGDVTTPESPYNSVSTERTGSTSDPGGSVNNLDASGSVSLTTVVPVVSKVIVGTSLATTFGTNVAIGEQVQYQVTVTVRDGVINTATLTDTLPAGLAIVSLDSISASPTLSTSQGGGFGSVLTAAVIGSNGSSVSLNFGTLTIGRALTP